MDTSSGDSNIVFSSNDSFNVDVDPNAPKADKDILLDQENILSSHSSGQLSAKFKQLERAESSVHESASYTLAGSYGDEGNDDSSQKMSSFEDANTEEGEGESLIEDGLIEAEVEPILGEF